MSFAHPLILAPLAPLLLLAAWRMLRTGRHAGVRFSALRRVPAKAAGWRAVVAAIAPFVLLAGLALLVVAAARPRTIVESGRRHQDAIAMVMTVDVSGSMSNIDLAPAAALERFRRSCPCSREVAERFASTHCRLAVMKRLFADFVDKRPDDCIGLVVFASHAEQLSPLTNDRRCLKAILREVEIPEEANTAIGDGLGLALAALEDAVPKSKVVILLSDGENNCGSDPAEVAAVAAHRGVKIYTIGIGTRDGRMPVLRGFFGRFELAEAREKVLDERQLKGLAERTGGRYFPVTDAGALEDALSTIDQLEKTAVDSDRLVRWREHFVLPLVVGALLCALSIAASLAAARRLA